MPRDLDLFYLCLQELTRFSSQQVNKLNELHDVAARKGLQLWYWYCRAVHTSTHDHWMPGEWVEVFLFIVNHVSQATIGAFYAYLTRSGYIQRPSSPSAGLQYMEEEAVLFGSSVDELLREQCNLCRRTRVQKMKQE